MKKKLISLNLVFLMVLTLLPIGIARADVPEDETQPGDEYLISITFHYFDEEGIKREREVIYTFNTSVSSFGAPDASLASGKVFLGWNTVDKDNLYGESAGDDTDPEVTENPEVTESPEVTEDDEETPEIMQAAEVAEDEEVDEQWIYGNEPVYGLFMNGIHDLYARYEDVPEEGTEYIILYYAYGLSPDGRIRRIVELTADGTVTLPSELYDGQKAIYWYTQWGYVFYPCGDVEASKFTFGDILITGTVYSDSFKYAVIDGNGGETENGSLVAVAAKSVATPLDLTLFADVAMFTKEDYVLTGYKGEKTEGIYSLADSIGNAIEVELENQVAKFTAQYVEEPEAESYILYIGNGATTTNGEEFYVQDLSSDDAGLFLHGDEIFGIAPSGKRFIGWKDSSGRWFDGGTAIGSDETIILYAQWGQNRVTYYSDGAIIDYIIDGTTFRDAPTKDGYTFTGWNNKADGTGDTYAAGAEIPEFITILPLHAQWTAASTQNPVIPSPGATGTPGGTGNNTTTTTERNPDGSTTTTTTNRTTGTVTETTRYPDGSTSTVETQTNGTVTTTERAANGVETKTVDQPGRNVTATVTIPRNVASATVTVPADVTPGTVAIDADTGEIIKLSIPTADGMEIKLDSSANIILVDNSRYFNDVNAVNHWANDSVAFVSSHELFVGTGDTTFSPESLTTRAQLMTVLARLDGVDANSSDALQKGMEWATAFGISDGSAPNSNISRQEVAVMMWRYAGNPTSSYQLNVSDAGDIADYAQIALAWAVENGILNGYPDGSLQPGTSASRAHVAAMVQRFCATLV